MKIIARAAFKLYCRDLQLNNKELLKSKGPLLLAANHPNSFLDAIIICTLFNEPVYSLARGDVFKGKHLTRLLLSLKLLPVYRVSEGAENLEENYKTFDLCKEIFKNNGIVLIFSEGKCINEWHLRPLKKGTARLAISSWQDGIPLKVLPVAINYSSFRKYGKNLKIGFGDLLNAEAIAGANGYGKALQVFNSVLQRELEPSVVEINENDKKRLHAMFYVHQPALKKVLLSLPALVGLLLHAPAYLPVRRFIQKKLRSKDHYDSLIVAVLFLVYPLYVVALTLLTFAIIRQWYAFVLMLILPFTAWCHLQLKDQLD